jgi:hypothetical protein
MLKIMFGIFFILHGLVHLLYFGQSQRFFKLQPGMVWPDGAWAFSKLLKKKAIRLLAGYLCLFAAFGFITGGISLFARHVGWYYLVVGSSLFSSLVFLLFWDGKVQNLDEKGAIGVLINLAILVLFLFYHYPV